MQNKLSSVLRDTEQACWSVSMNALGLGYADSD